MLRDYPKPPFADQPQDRKPGLTARMTPRPDHGEASDGCNGRLSPISHVSPEV